MFWSAILPFQITAFLWAAIILAVGILAQRFRKKRAPYVTFAVVIALILFIPSMVSVAKIVDGYHFGVFEHPDFASLNDWRVERYFPNAARDITLQKTEVAFERGTQSPNRTSNSGLTSYGTSGVTSHGELGKNFRQASKHLILMIWVGSHWTMP